MKLTIVNCQLFVSTLLYYLIVIQHFVSRLVVDENFGGTLPFEELVKDLRVLLRGSE